MAVGATSEYAEPTPWLTYFTCVTLAFVAFGAIGYTGYMVWLRYPKNETKEEWEIAGTQGDFTGGHIAAGASLASTLLFVAALLLQSAELRSQRRQFQHEMAVQRQEARGARCDGLGCNRTTSWGPRQCCR